MSYVEAQPLSPRARRRRIVRRRFLRRPAAVASLVVVAAIGYGITVMMSK